MYMVVTVASPKDKMINVRLSPTVHDQFKIACELRGVSMSSLLHQFIVRVIREEKNMDPDAFQDTDGLRPARIARVKHLEDEVPVRRNEGVRNKKN